MGDMVTGSRPNLKVEVVREDSNKFSFVIWREEYSLTKRWFLYAPERIWRSSRAGPARRGISLAQTLAYQPPPGSWRKGRQAISKSDKGPGQNIWANDPLVGLFPLLFLKLVWTRDLLGGC